MDFRLRHLLRSVAPRDAARIDLALLRAALLIASCVAVLPAALSTGPRGPAGAFVMPSLSALSLVFAWILAARLGSDSIGDVRSGLLGLVLLAGTSPWQWVLLRCAQMWIAFLSVWIVRIPLLLFAFTLGGVPPQAMLASELALLLAFCVLSSLSLRLSFGAESRRQVSGQVLLVVFAWNVLLTAPRLLVSAFGGVVPAGVKDAVLPLLDRVSQFSLNVQLQRATASDFTARELGPAFAVYGTIALLLLLWFWRLVGSVGTWAASDRPAPAAARRRALQRASRRVWDDALAWQAFAYYSRGSQMVRIKLAGYALLAIGAWTAIHFGLKEFVLVSLPVLSGGLLLHAINKPGECLTRELSEATISTLLLTPHDGREFAAGWRRGAWRLAAPDLALWSILTLASALLSPNAPAVMLCIGMVLVSSNRFFILSPLLPFNVYGITSGLAMIVVFTAVAIACSLAGALIHPYMAPLVLAPLLWGLTSILDRSLPLWLDRKLATAL